MKVQLRSIVAMAALGLTIQATAMAAAPSASAQPWPTRPVRFIVSLGAGSGVDIAARLIADRLSARWAQPVLVENRPGGDAIMAINAVIGAHDDHILLYTPTSSLTAHPYQHAKMPYDPQALTPLARVTTTVLGFVISPTLKVHTLADFIALIRAQPGELNYSTGTGMTDVLYDAFFKRENLQIARVGYRDVISPMTDLAEGRIHAYIAGLPVTLPHVQAGRAKLVAVTNTARAASHPDVPTVAEAGFPALTFDGLVGVYGPSDIQAQTRERIAADLRAVLSEPEIVARLNRMGAVVTPGGGADFAASLVDQRDKLAEAAKLLGISAGK